MLSYNASAHIRRPLMKINDKPPLKLILAGQTLNDSTSFNFSSEVAIGFQIRLKCQFSNWAFTSTDSIVYLQPFCSNFNNSPVEARALPRPISHRQVSIKCAAYFPAVAVKTETGAQMSSFPSRKNSKLVPPAPPPLQYTEGGSTLLLYKLNGVDVWEARVCKLAAHRSDISPRGRNSTKYTCVKCKITQKRKMHSQPTDWRPAVLFLRALIIYCAGGLAWMSFSVHLKHSSKSVRAWLQLPGVEVSTVYCGANKENHFTTDLYPCDLLNIPTPTVRRVQFHHLHLPKYYETCFWLLLTSAKLFLNLIRISEYKMWRAELKALCFYL